MKVMSFHVRLKMFFTISNFALAFVGSTFYPFLGAGLLLKVLGGPICVMIFNLSFCFMLCKYRKVIHEEKVSQTSIRIVKRAFSYLGFCGLISRPFGNREHSFTDMHHSAWTLHIHTH